MLCENSPLFHLVYRKAPSVDAKTQYLAIFVAVICLHAVSEVNAGSFGTISGIVYDKESGQPLSGADILVQSTLIGTVSDAEGRFLLTHLQPGEYAIEVRYIGYKRFFLLGIHVRADTRSRVIVPLEKGVIKGESVSVTAKRSLLQKGITGSAHFISEDEIQLMPIQSILEVVDLLPGNCLYDRERRGGRDVGANWRL